MAEEVILTQDEVEEEGGISTFEESKEKDKDEEEELKKRSLEEKVKDLEARVKAIEEMLRKYPLPSKYPYPQKKGEEKNQEEEEEKQKKSFDEWADFITKSVQDLTSRDTKQIEELKKAVSERDTKIKELSDRLEIVENRKIRKSLAGSGTEDDLMSTDIIVKDGKVYRE